LNDPVVELDIEWKGMSRVIGKENDSISKPTMMTMSSLDGRPINEPLRKSVRLTADITFNDNENKG